MCEECEGGVWMCGGECGGGADVEWERCGDAYLPTPIGLRYGVRVLAGRHKKTGEIRVRLIPKDISVPTRSRSGTEKELEKEARFDCCCVTGDCADECEDGKRVEGKKGKKGKKGGSRRRAASRKK